MAVLFGHSDDREGDARDAMELARRAVALDSSFARSHSALGLAYSAVGRSADAIAAARRAVELQPGDADSRSWLARCLMWAGEGEEACEAAQTALRLDPQYVEGPYLNLLARVSLIAGRYEDTVNAYERNDARGGPVGQNRHAMWAAALAYLGRADEAADKVRQLVRDFPEVTLAKAGEIQGTMSDREQRRLIDGLRKAGLPE